MHSKFTASALGCSEETLFISFSKGVTGKLRDRTCLEKNTNECSCLICDFSRCRTSCVSVQPCTPKVLPNTETFLHSRVFFVTCVVPALCQIMYSLSVCSDRTTSAAPWSFRQNRPPACTLSLTYCTSPPCHPASRAPALQLPAPWQQAWHARCSSKYSRFERAVSCSSPSPRAFVRANYANHA